MEFDYLEALRLEAESGNPRAKECYELVLAVLNAYVEETTTQDVDQPWKE